MEDLIHDRGRGPEIKGTRITVYDILDYRGKYTTEWIAEFFKVTIEQVEAAYAHIDSHKDTVLAAYDRMNARARDFSSPEAIASAERGRKRMELVRNRIAQRKMEQSNA